MEELRNIASRKEPIIDEETGKKVFPEYFEGGKFRMEAAIIDKYQAFLLFQ